VQATGISRGIIPPSRSPWFPAPSPRGRSRRSPSPQPSPTRFARGRGSPHAEMPCSVSGTPAAPTAGNMLLTITTTHCPATDLGYLLHKHPGRTQSFHLAYGTGHVFYTEASASRCTAALLLDIDPVALSRRQSEDSAAPLQPYVNDRPYVASSLLSVAIAQVFGSALSGHCSDRAELAATPIPLEARIPVIPCRGGEAILRRLFEPLGYELELQRLPLDPMHPEWEPGGLFSLRLSCERPLKELLAHLYVLIPVLDDEKHYWVGKDEVDKLLRHG